MNKSIVSLLDECRPFMIKQCAAACEAKLKTGHGLAAMSHEEKRVYEVERWEELSSAVFFLLHSGYGGFTRNYVAKYNVNRLLVGFDNIEQLVHFSNFVIQQYEEISDRQVVDLQNGIKEAACLTDEERNQKYTMYHHIYNSLKENPFPPNRMELLNLLRQNENLDVEVENCISLWLFIGPVYEALNKIGSSNIDDILLKFDPTKEKPTIEGSIGVAVTRSRT